MVEVDAAAAAPIRNDEQQQINGYTKSKKENESANEKYAVQAPSRGSQQDEIIREVVQIFEKKNAAQLRSMVNTLCATRSLTFQRYVEVNYVCVFLKMPSFFTQT
ncbi:unnamed protein product [Gongylonema pulchrum]|uniref:MIF4G domain-containing protein n=1 Tax=Gongylonema pulchrum TaxID=637853 RepID=A0A183EZF1_9BILA|nr:unnamed protein product [Gongylonema pulchrum]